ncbi:TPA: glycoside hydrolase family protein [Enterobacter cloacae]|nr:glycoside hydrolase family protein [Enterobacter cloacae]HCR0905063.1 glycoside hydrolase family protein [Enterobacter cloacae]
MNLREKLIKYEGTKEYQKKLGYYRNGKFYKYRDSLGYFTIGYGHLITSTENFDNGLTEVEANALLDRDIQKAQQKVGTLGIDVPDDWLEFLTIAIFQLGLAGLKKFKRMLTALEQKDYSEAVRQAKDSLWYRQTKSRVDQMIEELTNK